MDAANQVLVGCLDVFSRRSRLGKGRTIWLIRGDCIEYPVIIYGTRAGATLLDLLGGARALIH
jgi:hypothetical protein